MTDLKYNGFMKKIRYTIDSFSVENFRSILKKQTLIFDSQLKAFYGANASGKTNLYKAMVIFRQFVRHSADPGSHGVPYEPFLLSDVAGDKNVCFEMTFHDDERNYFSYSFELAKDFVADEELRVKTNGRSRLIFRRSLGSNDSATRNGFGKKFFNGNEAVRKDSLLITLARSTQNPYADAVYRAVSSINYIDLSAANSLRGRAVDLLQEKPILYDKLIKLFDEADFSIESLSYNVTSIKPEMLENAPFSDDVKKQILASGKSVTINTTHAVRNKDGDKVGSTIFNMGVHESLGTSNFFVLMTLVLDTILEGKMLYVDEFGASMHTELCKFIIKLFKKSKTEAKLVINTHDVGLIKNGPLGILERDEIMIVEKDVLSETIITPLKDKMHRSDENVGKKYMLGLYGGVPIMSEVEK